VLLLLLLLQGKQYLCVPIADDTNTDITSWFSACNDFIHVARRNKGSVLVHWYQLTFIALASGCRVGMNPQGDKSKFFLGFLGMALNIGGAIWGSLYV